ncbi:hypothetical protein AC578_4007 [Pseudocercospora eumusae]|uniref:BTB domain-containing protein n=1 Tax=Pseudocercospora eumusae TaxID=321146 RepID=A0A139HLS0_9PEZI|nr:hypothetical protein AC578_4007 [Pseudocercospora eumusae]
MTEATAALGKQLQSDRLVKLYVGKNNDIPYLIPESRLKQASEYFTSAIKHERWGSDNIGKLHFPDDDKRTFEILIYFIVNGSLPEFDRKDKIAMQKLMIDSWLMADQYLMHDFQDQLMIQLLIMLDDEALDWEVVRFGFQKGSEGSKIWRLMAEEAVHKTYRDAQFGAKSIYDVKPLEEAILGIPGALGEFLKTRESADQNPSFYDRLGRRWKTEPFLYGSFALNSRARIYARNLKAEDDVLDSE